MSPGLSQFPADAKVLARELKPILDAMEKGRLKSMARISSGTLTFYGPLRVRESKVINPLSPPCTMLLTNSPKKKIPSNKSRKIFSQL